MEWPRMKTIIIVILLMMNGFLLVLVGMRRSELRRYEQSALNGTLQVLAEKGIQMSEDQMPTSPGRQPCSTQRDVAAETAMVAALLGESVEGVNRGGGLYTYRTDRGQVSLRSGGEITAVLADDPRWRTDDPAAHSAHLLREMGVELTPGESTVVEGSGQITYGRQLLGGTPVFSCHITFSYTDGLLTGLSGSLLAVSAITESAGELLSLPTVLMRFLDSVLSSGDVCSAILSVEPGYLTVPSFTATVELTPVWRIATNTGYYYVDGITGEMKHLSGG